MFGEVFICQFPFTSGATSKLRPALVLFDLQDDAIICRITSAMRTGLLDVALKDWRTAGLLRPSVARLDRIVTAEKTVFARRLGSLSSADAEAVRRTWNQHMRL
jgi:mRNA-degrading endonuclease toxin of MazEF toxin-antitoxin module